MISANFAFLSAHDELLVRLGALAERNFASDPQTSLVKLRRLGELLAQNVAAAAGLPVSSADKQFEVLCNLRSRGLLTPEIEQLFHGLRMAGNRAVHRDQGSQRDALHQLKMARKLAIWFHKSFGDRGFKPKAFVPPPDPVDAEETLQSELAQLREDLENERIKATQAVLSAAEQARLRAEAEAAAKAAYDDSEAALQLSQEAQDALSEQENRFTAHLAELQKVAAKAPPAEVQALVEAAQVAAEGLELSEVETRKIIDLQLQEAGWEVDTQRIRHARGARPIKGRNRAIAEWPTRSGPADYVLFVGLTPVAVVEAKRKRIDVRGAIPQAKRYSRDFSMELEIGPGGAGLQAPQGGPWDTYKIPFLFASNGRPYLRQLLEASGVWFLDARRSTNHPRALEGWYTPDGLRELLRHDIEAADKRLAAEPSDDLPLRDYQREAIASVEAGIANGRRELLLAMATGTGKTRTCICLLYRLLKAGRFRRALFLVDRSALGEQAQEAFKSLKLEQQQSFAEIYDIKELGDIRPSSDTRLHFATIQGMVRRLFEGDEHTEPMPVDQYDIIVIDECHRGYNLDRELSDAEFAFRSEEDYISKYRRVLDHFDAIKVGLTATPAKHTTEIFGAPIYTYSYRQAVIDGNLVDHEPPIRIITKLAQDGITWEAGEEIEVYRVRQQELDLVNTPDEVTIELESFNQRVLTENFNRVVCRELAEQIDPKLPGKTLIFCATDRHADTVVALLKAAFKAKYSSCEDDAVIKITGKADKPAQLLRNYKNERNPRVAVTVDLLTTGIDVPEITNIVFLRRIKSRILYEQMMGRATRLCPEIGKRYFRIFDAVDLYRALEPYSAMKPVVTDPKITFAQLIVELAGVVDDPELAGIVCDQLRAKLQRKRRSLPGPAYREFETRARAGGDLDKLLAEMGSWSPSTILVWWTARAQLGVWLDQERGGSGPVLLISKHEDELLRVERGYGNATRPEDYLDSFGAYIRDNINKIPALAIVTKRPRDLTRAQLCDLKLAFDDAGFTEANLETAWRETTNVEVVATIIGYIRRQALGSALVSYEDRVKGAMDRIMRAQAWSTPQRKWLTRIGKQLMAETIVDRESFERGAFKQNGGFARLNGIFDGELEQLLGTIHEELWSDAG